MAAEREPAAVCVPKESANDETVKVAGWLAADGERVAQGQAVVEIETSKAVIEIRAPRAGYVARRHAEGAEARVGEVLFLVCESPAAAPAEKGAGPAARAGPDRFSRKARELIERHKLRAEDFTGLGLVRESDVLAALARSKVSAESTSVDRVEPLPPAKLAEIRYLSAGQNAGLASVVSTLCRTRGLREIARRNPDWGGSLLPVLIFESARLLPGYPTLNSCYEEGAIRYYERVDVGFAVDAGRGLKVPIVHDAARKPLAEIARETEDLLLRYVNDELDGAALSGGTFTVTDLSGEGVFGVVPLINFRQAAILGVGGELPWTGSEAVFQLTLAFDHRVTEGRVAAAFLKALSERLGAYEARS